MIYGLLGYPLIHSFSPKYFNDKFKQMGFDNADYLLFEMETLDEIRSLSDKYPDLRGFNVTIPHKENIMLHLDDIDPTAKAVGAVNTVKITDGRWVGYNTDVSGFRHAIADWLDGLVIRSALILGSGGAAKAAKYVLEQVNIHCETVSRKGPFSYADIDAKRMQLTDLIVNATPVGMFPKVDEAPTIPYSQINPKHFCYDMIYNPEKTIFLTRAEKNGASIRNGHSMLLAQAEASWEIWQDKRG